MFLNNGTNTNRGVWSTSMLIKYIVYISENAHENHTRTITIVRALAEQEKFNLRRHVLSKSLGQAVC